MLTLLKAVSVVLAAGSLSFLLSEWRVFRKAFSHRSAMVTAQPDTGRLLRRTVGSSMLLLMSILMFMGELPDHGRNSPDEVLHLFYYWATVVGLAVMLGMVALFDAFAGMKRLSTYVSTEEGKELSALADQLRKADLRAELVPEVVDEATVAKD